MREFNTRTTKDNYSITFETDDRKAFEQVQSLCRLLIDGKDGDAIPAEWMYKWRMKHNEQYNVGLSSFSQMISDWEKENEID